MISTMSAKKDKNQISPRNPGLSDSAVGGAEVQKSLPRLPIHFTTSQRCELQTHAQSVCQLQQSVRVDQSQQTGLLVRADLKRHDTKQNDFERR